MQRENELQFSGLLAIQPQNARHNRVAARCIRLHDLARRTAAGKLHPLRLAARRSSSRSRASRAACRSSPRGELRQNFEVETSYIFHELSLAIERELLIRHAHDHRVNPVASCRTRGTCSHEQAEEAERFLRHARESITRRLHSRNPAFSLEPGMHGAMILRHMITPALAHHPAPPRRPALCGGRTVRTTSTRRVSRGPGIRHPDSRHRQRCRSSYFLRRALKEAQRANASAVILDVDTLWRARGFRDG